MVISRFLKSVVKIILFLWKIKFLLEKLNLFKANEALAKKRIFSEIEFCLQNSLILSFFIFNSVLPNLGFLVPFKSELSIVDSSKSLMSLKKYLL